MAPRVAGRGFRGPGAVTLLIREMALKGAVWGKKCFAKF
jgi:hypothetical protein